MRLVRKLASTLALLTLTVGLTLVGTAAGPPADYTFHTFQYAGALDTVPWGITNQGVVTGLTYPPDFSFAHGFLYSVDRGLKTFDAPFPGAAYTYGYQMNQKGEIAVGFDSAELRAYGAIYDSRRGTWTLLPAPDPSAVQSQGSGINNRGQVFGGWTADPFLLNQRGWVYEKGRYTFFDAPGASPDFIGTVVISANDRGDCVGYFFDADFASHGFIRYGRGRIETVDVPFEGASETRLRGINNRGTMVGYYTGADGRQHGFILEKGAFTTFDVPGFLNTNVTAINDRGDLSGIAYDSFDNPSTAFLAIRK